MRNRKKKVKIFSKLSFVLIFFILVFSIFMIEKTLASTKSFIITSVELCEKTDTVNVSGLTVDDNVIHSNIVFHELGDSATFAVTIKNNNDKKYKIKSVSDDNSNKYIKYEFSKCEGEEFNSKEQKTFLINAKYVKEITDLTQRKQDFSVNFDLELEDEEGNSTHEDIVVNPTDEKENKKEEKFEISTKLEEKSKNNKAINPKTGDKIGIYIAIAAISSGFLICTFVIKQGAKIKSGKLLNKNSKTLVIILVLVCVTTFLKVSNATNEKETINLKFENSIELNDKLIVKYIIDGKEEERVVNYKDIVEEPEVLEKEGYTFKGWYTAPIGGKKISDSQEIINDIIYYARYEINRYKIQYNLDKGIAVNPTEYTVEDEITLNNPMRPGYTFCGWTGSNGDVYQTRVTINKGTTGNKTYKANYSVNEDTKYTVVHKLMDLDGINYTVENIEVLHGVTDTIVKPQTNNYEGFESPEEQEIQINGDGTSTIEYKYERKKYTLTIEDRDKVKSENNILSGKYFYNTYVKLEAKDVEGYEFISWNDGNTNKVIEFNLAQDTTIKPLYRVKEYNINYNYNEGTIIDDTNPLTYTVEDDEFSLKNPTKAKYRFDGWSGTGINGIQKTVTIPKGSTGERTYSAHFRNIESEIIINVENEEIFKSTKNVTLSTNLVNVSDNEVKKQYSLDNGVTWNDYTTPIVFTENGTILARILFIEDNQIIGENSKNITKVHEAECVIEIVESTFNETEFNKTITIYFEPQYIEEGKFINQYSINNGTTWINYTEPFDITETTTIKARCIKKADNSIINSTQKDVEILVAHFNSFDGYNSVFGLSSINKSSITYFGKSNENLTTEIMNQRINNGETIYTISNESNDSYKSQYKVYGWIDNGNFYWWSNADVVYFHPNTTKAFANYGNIVNIDLRGTNTEEVKNFASWFFNNRKLKRIEGTILTDGLVLEYKDGYNYNTADTSDSSDKGFAFMFNDCNLLEHVDVSKFNTTNASDMKRMFAGCKKLENLDLRHFDTKNVKNMVWMFRQCQAMTEIDVSSFDTGKVESMMGMFVETSNVQKVYLGNKFDTNNVVIMQNMFYGMSKLTTIYAKKDFNTTSLQNSSGMFNNTNILVGGNGTTSNGNARDVTYAKIDNETQQGFFTLKTE